MEQAHTLYGMLGLVIVQIGIYEDVTLVEGARGE